MAFRLIGEPPVRRSTFATLASLTIVCAAAQTRAEAATPGDPWEGFNRRGFAIHQTLDRYLIAPIAAIYRALTPGPIGRGLHNMLTNLSEPEVAINDILQGRLRRADISTLRFLVNSTVGIGGLLDVVAHADPAAAYHENSFGVTLGRWGVKPGPYLFIPLLGPSTIRDLIGGGVDASADPFHWVHYPGRTELTTSGAILGGIDLRVRTGPGLASLLSGAADPYATMRSVYLQNRQAQVDGVAVQPIGNLPDIEDVPPPPSSSSAPDQAAPPPPPPPPPPNKPTPAAPAPGPVSSEVIRSSGGRYA
jgi:phospholipid-binding lipoprotein MlaA